MAGEIEDPDMVLRRTFVQSLFGDVRLAERAIVENDSQFHRRNLVRTLFSVVDGMSSMLKEDAIALAVKRKHQFSPAELAILREETYSLDKDGKATTKSGFASTEANVRFAIQTYIRLHEPEFSVDVGGEGWAAFKAALQIRHRLTHPTLAKSLEVTDAELETVKLASEWFEDQAVGEQAKSLGRVAQKITAELQERIAEHERKGRT